MPKRARVIAFYLPQYHPIPENDMWWGKGFTEWTQVARAQPLYQGHQQPRFPTELGYYDLRLEEVREAQAQLAQEHGVEAFCYWHYWFAGRRLLERPAAEMLQTGKPGFPFCLAWANATWSGVWYGAPERTLIAQTYPGKSDYLAHFEALRPYFEDPRYLTVEGAPLFVVYQPHQLPNPQEFTDLFREWAHQAGFKGLHLVGNHPAGWRWERYGFDAITRTQLDLIEKYQPLSAEDQQARSLRGEPVRVFAYQDAMEYFHLRDGFWDDEYPVVIPNWDNSPRSGARGFILHGSTPDLFAQHLETTLDSVQHRAPEHRIVFLKSWNEWAEGNYVEPDSQWGRAYLEVIRTALSTETVSPNAR